MKRLVRAAAARVIDGADALWLLGARADDAALLEGDAAELARAILDIAREPHAREEILARITELAGGTLEHPETVEQAIDLLTRFGALGEEQHARAPQVDVFGHVVVAVTGAIASLRAPLLVERLLAAGHEVTVAMTRAARRFVTPRSFEALTHRRVATSLWSGTPRVPVPHVELAEWADLVIVYPCTATTIARLAAGDCSEIVSAIATTTRAPVLLAPSANPAMLDAPAVRANLDALRARGFFLAHPAGGFEVADAPDARARRVGGAAPIEAVVRGARLLLSRVVENGPRLATKGEWDAEHARADAAAVEDEALLAMLPAPPSRVLDLGTGLGAMARAAASRGHAVVATDFSPGAIEHAHAVDPSLPITWLVDDATDSKLRGVFDVVIDRGTFGCVAAARRARYVAQVASLLRPGGAWLLEVHRAGAAPVRAHAFAREEIEALVAARFEIAGVRESTLRFGAAGERPAWIFRLLRG